MKSMPPSGVFGVTMDDDALIEAEIAQQLENIDLDAEDLQDPFDNIEEIEDIDIDFSLENVAIPENMQGYIHQIQQQSAAFEKELAECDDLLQDHLSDTKIAIPTDDLEMLETLAKERGESPETYRRKVLEITEDDRDLFDTSELLGDKIEDDSQVDNSRALVHLDEKQVEFQKMLRQNMMFLEQNQRERDERLKKDLMNERQKEEEILAEQERKWKQKIEILQKEETMLAEERKIQQEKFEEEMKEKEKEVEVELKNYEEEIIKLEKQTQKELEQFALKQKEEQKRKSQKEEASATKIQANFRGFCVRKLYRQILEDKRQERSKLWEEERLKAVEEEIERQREEDRLKKEEEEMRQKKIEEEAARQKAEKEAKRIAKEEEKKAAEAKRKAEEEARKRAKEEERARKEEEKKKAEEEKRRKAEEEKRRKAEEEKRRKDEEEAKRKAKEEQKRKIEEEKKIKAEEERKRKAEEEARKVEEEKKRKAEDEARKAEEEKKRKAEDEARKVEEQNRKSDEDARRKEEEKTRKKEFKDTLNGDCKEENNKEQEVQSVFNGDIHRNIVSNSGLREKEMSETHTSSDKDTEKPGHSTTVDCRKSPRKKHSQKPKSARQNNKNSSMDLDIDEIDDTKFRVEASKQFVDGLPGNLDKLRIEWIKNCIPWSKVSNEPWKLKTDTSKKSVRRPTSAKKLQALSEDIITMAAKVSTLRQVTTVELHDLPGCSIATLGQCWGLKTLKMTNCNLTVIEGLQQCKQLHYIDFKDNFIQYLDLKDLGNLTFADFSHNALGSIHGLSGCSNLRWLDLSYNKITRLGGLETLRRLHTLFLSNNQLISTSGLGDTPTLQTLDLSRNHLQNVDDINKLCLLQNLHVSSNNLQKLPNLQNHVLLRELRLEDNSITSLDDLKTFWLPLLQTFNVSQNSIEELTSFENLHVLENLDTSHNQIIECEQISNNICHCVHLENLYVSGNPATETSELDSIKSLSRLKKIDDRDLKASGDGPVKPRNNYEAMCLSQSHLYREMSQKLQQELTEQRNKSPLDLMAMCEVYFKYCDKTHQLAEEHRYTHEYGEITMAMPTAPSTPKSGTRPNSSQSRRIMQKEDNFLNPKEMFEKALKSSNKGSVAVENTPVNKMNGEVSNGYDGKYGLISDKTTVVTAKTVKHMIDQDQIEFPKDSSSLENVAATKIQSCWRGYHVRKEYPRSNYNEEDYLILQELHAAATKIQATWRGYFLRLKLEQALEYARFEDDDDFNFEEVNIDDFNFDEGMLDDWKPPPTPQIPAGHPVIGKPPSGKLGSPPGKVPPLNFDDKAQPLPNPRRAWRGMDSPMSDVQQNGFVPRPPSIMSASDTHRTVMSKKEEKLSEEWGFKDSNTAHLMLQRAKKLKYNSERRKKLGKLDPKQRLALFRKLEENNMVRKPLAQPSRRTLPRKEYFQARQEEIEKQELEKRVMQNMRNSRTYEWLHSQVGSFENQDQPIHNLRQARAAYGSDNNLPRMNPEITAGRPVRLTSSPSLDLQSVDSASLQGELTYQARRPSLGNDASNTAKFPPIKTNSAGSNSSHKRERISFRTPEKNKSVGWGGGRKRGSII